MANDERQPIPRDVYYSAEHVNFYGAANRGCGNDFFHRWKARRDEFPQSKEALENVQTGHYGTSNWPKPEPGTEAFEADLLAQEHLPMLNTPSLTGVLVPPVGQVVGCVLTINVVHDPSLQRSSYEWTAHYAGETDDYGQGSTPYMAIKDLIDNINPTEKVSAQKTS